MSRLLDEWDWVKGPDGMLVPVRKPEPTGTQNIPATPHSSTVYATGNDQFNTNSSIDALVDKFYSKPSAPEPASSSSSTAVDYMRIQPYLEYDSHGNLVDTYSDFGSYQYGNSSYGHKRASSYTRRQQVDDDDDYVNWTYPCINAKARADGSFPICNTTNDKPDRYCVSCVLKGLDRPDPGYVKITKAESSSTGSRQQGYGSTQQSQSESSSGNRRSSRYDYFSRK
ncbi:hypothetical protein GGS21DRAFT_488451 [Xylaria nigripes]|nr:hypothetical protein GGS21DRAFT_488451 [Xylaria nigripes]